MLRQAGLHGASPRRFVLRTTDSANLHPIAPHQLATRPAPTGPNQIWVADLTYVPTATGWLYVAVIMDLWSRRVIGWSADVTLATTTVLAAWPWPFNIANRQSGCSTTRIVASNTPVTTTASRWRQSVPKPA